MSAAVAPGSATRKLACFSLTRALPVVNPLRPAARLIEDAGLKGFTTGKARVSEKHANFLVALPGATAADIVALAAEVKRRVREQSGHDLAEEVRRLGF